MRLIQYRFSHSSNSCRFRLSPTQTPILALTGNCVLGAAGPDALCFGVRRFLSSVVPYLSLLFPFLDSKSSPVPNMDNWVPLAFFLGTWNPELFGWLLDPSVARDSKFDYHLSVHLFVHILYSVLKIHVLRVFFHFIKNCS